MIIINKQMKHVILLQLLINIDIITYVTMLLIGCH